MFGRRGRPLISGEEISRIMRQLYAHVTAFPPNSAFYLKQLNTVLHRKSDKPTHGLRKAVNEMVRQGWLKKLEPSTGYSGAIYFWDGVIKHVDQQTADLVAANKAADDERNSVVVRKIPA